MTSPPPAPLTAAPSKRLTQLVTQLLERRAAPDHWEGSLASSALSTGTAVLALHLVEEHRPGDGALRGAVGAGARWLVAAQNADGGWGDTMRSGSNISTTAIVWSALSVVESGDGAMAGALTRAAAWLREASGGGDHEALRSAILRRYGKDRTFSVPILTVLALAGKLGPDRAAAWRSIPQLPFEFAALPHAWFDHLRLPVVSYALPALIAIGQVRHRFAPTGNPLTRLLRNRVRRRTLRVLREMQPESGGYLEATPLTSFVVMSLAAAGETEHPVVAAGVRFLLASIRRDGSWPIDTNLATWVTTLAVGALATYKSVMGSGVIFPDRLAIREWLLRQQSTRQHPFTHAAPGAWAWTPLSGGVPDADDTAGALLALRALAEPDERTVASAAAGVRWLVGLQNRDGGIPTFCRGWGALPFDRSTPELTAHALRAWDAWDAALEPSLRRSVRRAASRALRYLERAQRPDGSWVPLWFGSETAPDEENPVYGTARVLLALGPGTASLGDGSPIHRRRAVRWLLGVQNDDGGWGGDRAVPSSIEETGVVLSALARLRDPQDARDCETAMSRAVAWLVAATGDRRLEASPIGLYFARLWYYEEMYPLVFAIEGLGSALARHEERAAVASASGRSAS